jgi:hypothetical protein
MSYPPRATTADSAPESDLLPSEVWPATVTPLRFVDAPALRWIAFSLEQFTR